MGDGGIMANGLISFLFMVSALSTSTTIAKEWQ